MDTEGGEKQEGRSTVLVGVRLKTAGVDALDAWRAPLDMSRQEFIRRLLRAEGIARSRGKSLVAGKVPQ